MARGRWSSSVWRTLSEDEKGQAFTLFQETADRIYIRFCKRFYGFVKIFGRMLASRVYLDVPYDIVIIILRTCLPHNKVQRLSICSYVDDDKKKSLQDMALALKTVHVLVNGCGCRQTSRSTGAAAAVTGEATPAVPTAATILVQPLAPAVQSSDSAAQTDSETAPVQLCALCKRDIAKVAAAGASGPSEKPLVRRRLDFDDDEDVDDGEETPEDIETPCSQFTFW
jgi:hypothetical protein